jgi:hypothetical protein
MIVLVVATLTLAQYIFAVDLGIDEIIMQDSTALIGTSAPGRMAASTALFFMVSGFIILLNLYGKIRIAQILSIFLLLASFLPLLGYVISLPELYGPYRSTEMAAHTTLGFLLISLSGLCFSPGKGIVAIFTEHSIGGHLARRIVPLALIIPVFLVVFGLGLERMEILNPDRDILIIAGVLILVFLGLAWGTLHAINALDAQQKEIALESAEWQELLHYVVQNDPNAIAVHDKDLRYIFASDRYRNDYRLGDINIIGRHHYDVFPDIPDKWRDIHQRALNGEILKSEDDSFVRQDGSVEHTRWECRPWYKKDGSIGGIILYTEVITERKKVETRLRETGRRLALVLDHAGDGIFAVDREGRTILINKAALEMLGYEESELLGQVMHRIHHHTQTDGNPYPPEACPIYQAFRKGEIHTRRDEVFWRKDGSYFPVEYISTPIVEEGMVTGAVVSFSDITDSQKAGQEIKRLNKQLLLLVEAIKNLSMSLSREEIQKTVASAARKLANADGATFVLRDGEYCHYLEEDTITPLWKGNRYRMDECISGWVMMNNIPVVIPDISLDERIPQALYSPTFVKSLAVFPVNAKQQSAAVGTYWAAAYQPNDEEQRILRTLADAAGIALENMELLSDLEKRVEERTRSLEMANNELEAFSYSVSHDLRAPLRGVSGFTAMLLEKHGDRLDDEGLRICRVIKDSAQRMGQLIDDLLSFSRLARREIQKLPIDMNSLVNSIYHELAKPAGGARVNFTLELLENSQGDPSLLRQVWANLISNALKFSAKREKPEITVSCNREPGRVIYRIQDNGAGFDMKYKDKIFGVFQRLHGVQEFDGTGVGLAIVQRIIHRHGGEAGAEGEVDRGATFWFSLPDE